MRMFCGVMDARGGLDTPPGERGEERYVYERVMGAMISMKIHDLMPVVVRCECETCSTYLGRRTVHGENAFFRCGKSAERCVDDKACRESESRQDHEPLA